MDLRRFFLSIGFFLFTVTAQAGEISRCLSADGPPQFTNQPCPEGVPAEPLVVIENSPLDSRAARANMARYDKQLLHDKRTGPQVVLIRDTYTEERNERISEKKTRKQTKKKKGKKKQKTKTSDRQKAARPAS